MRSGESVAFHVVIENDSKRDVLLVLESADDFFGGSSVFWVKDTYDAQKRSVTVAHYSDGVAGALGALTSDSPPLIRVELPASTRAVGAVSWTATGYDPTKKYSIHVTRRPPLKPGKYRVQLETPFKRADGHPLEAWASVSVTR